MIFRDILLAIAVTAIWGFNFVVIRYGVDVMPPLLLTGLRFLFSAVPAIFFIAPPKAPLRIVIAFGFLLGVVKFGSLFTAIKLGMPAGLASLVMQMQVFFTIALAIVLMGDRPTRLQIIGAGVAIAGIALIAAMRGDVVALTPFLLTLTAALTWGFANIVAKKAPGADMLSFVVWASLVPPLPLIGLSLWLDGPQAVAAGFWPLGWTAVWTVFFLAIPATVFCFSVWTNLLNRYPTATVTPFALLVPVFGFLSGWLFLGEALTWPIAIGSLLVLAGLAINVFGRRITTFLRASG